MLQLNVNKELHLPGGLSSLNLEMEFHPGKVTGISGDSGVGKTTVIRMLAGLTDPDIGSILKDGKAWFDKAKNINLRPQERGLGFVFQDHQLFPNMSVIENLKFAASNHKNAVNKIGDYLDIFGLSEFKSSMPNSLSGGQSKRVAIIMALVRNPTLLLLDEPFAVLDEKMAIIVQDEILKYTHENRCVTVLVAHEITEIFKMTDFLYTIQNGKIISQGSPSEVFDSSASNDSITLVGIVVQSKVNNDGKNAIKVMANEQIIELFEIMEKYEIGEKILLKLGAGKVEISRPKNN